MIFYDALFYVHNTRTTVVCVRACVSACVYRPSWSKFVFHLTSHANTQLSWNATSDLANHSRLPHFSSFAFPAALWPFRHWPRVLSMAWPLDLWNRVMQSGYSPRPDVTCSGRCSKSWHFSFVQVRKFLMVFLPLRKTIVPQYDFMVWRK